MRRGSRCSLPLGEHGPGLHPKDEQENDGANDRKRLLMCARWQMQHVGERGQHQGADGQQQQRGDHPRRLIFEFQDAALRPAGHEGEAQDEERVDEDRADQRGLDEHDETGTQREDSNEQLG